MKKIFFISCSIALISLAGCKGSDSKAATGSATATTTESKSSGNTYFDFTVDGKELHINADDTADKAALVFINVQMPLKKFF